MAYGCQEHNFIGFLNRIMYIQRAFAEKILRA